MGYFAWLGELEPMGGVPEALPCPFCGCDEVWISAPNERTHLWDAQCRTCHSFGPTQTTIAALITSWNRRAGRITREQRLEVGAIRH